MYIERILGTPLTEELKEQIRKASQEEAKGDEITKANQALIIALAPALSFYAVYQGIPFHWAAIVNKGITVQESENSKAVDIKDIAQLRRWIKDDAAELANDLIEFLQNNRDKYPLWQPGNSCTDKKVLRQILWMPEYLYLKGVNYGLDCDRNDYRKYRHSFRRF